jgi:hypothetical protein
MSTLPSVIARETGLETMHIRSISSSPFALFAFVSALVPGFTMAANCVSRPELFELRSDTVEWLIDVGRSMECIQGLRGKTMILETVSILEQPKSGRLILQGPSFRYSAGPDAGVDSFRLAIGGTSLRVRGTSVLNVTVKVR